MTRALPKGAAMAGMASAHDSLEQDKTCLAKAKTVNQLRQARVVVLPLELRRPM